MSGIACKGYSKQSTSCYAVPYLTFFWTNCAIILCLNALMLLMKKVQRKAFLSFLEADRLPALEPHLPWLNISHPITLHLLCPLAVDSVTSARLWHKVFLCVSQHNANNILLTQALCAHMQLLGQAVASLSGWYLPTSLETTPSQTALQPYLHRV